MAIRVPSEIVNLITLHGVFILRATTMKFQIVNYRLPIVDLKFTLQKMSKSTIV